MVIILFRSFYSNFGEWIFYDLYIKTLDIIIVWPNGSMLSLILEVGKIFWIKDSAFPPHLCFSRRSLRPSSPLPSFRVANGIFYFFPPTSISLIHSFSFFLSFFLITLMPHCPSTCTNDLFLLLFASPDEVKYIKHWIFSFQTI